MSDSRNAKVRKKKSRCLESSDSDSSFERPARRKKPRQVLSEDGSSSDDNRPLLVRLRTRSVKTSRAVSDAESSSSSEDYTPDVKVEIVTSTNESGSESDGSDDESEESYEGEQSTSGSSVWQSDWLSHSEDEDWAVRVTTPARNRITQGAGGRNGAESRIATRTTAAMRAPATASRVPSSDSEESDGQSEKCPICLRSFTTQEIGTPEACDHSFCSECLQEWAKNVNTCPVDRQMFTLILVRKKLNCKVVRQIPVEERQLQVDVEPEDDPTYCEICGRNDREDRLLLCDGCDLGYHLECLEPPLSEVPIEQWFCPDCIAAGNTSLGEENLGEEIMHLWEERDEFEIQRQRRMQPEPRLMPRTRQNVRVSGRVRTRQLQRQADQPSTSSGLDSQDVESAVRRRSTRPTPARGRRAKVTRRKRRKKRATVTRKKIKKTKKVKIVNSDGEEEEVEVPCASKPRKRRKRRKKKTRKVVRRRVRTARVVVPLSTRNRIAEHLRMMAPQRPGQTIPDVRPQRTAGAPALGGLGFQRSRAGIPTLHLFGQRDQLDYFSGSDQEDGGGVCVVSRPRRASALRLLNKKVAPISPVTPCDLVSSILDSQSVWHSKKAEVTIKRDGSLQVKNKSEEKSDGLKEAGNKVEQTGSGRVDVKDPSHSQKVASRAPMYSGRSSGSGDSRPPPESGSRYSGSSFHNYQGGRGFVSVTGFDARSSRAGYSSFLSSPQTLPPPPMMTFRGGPVRFRMSPPRFPPVRSLRPPPLPPRLLHQQIAPTMMEAFDVDDEVRSREEDEEIDLYSDIEVGASCQADDEAEKSYEALPPPPIPPAMLMDFGEQPLSDDDERGSDAELVIDDNGPAQPEIPDSDIYDPASPSRDTDDEAETEKVEPVNIPLPPTRRLVQYSPDSSPPYEIGTYPALTEKLAMAATAVGLQSARNSSDEEEESAECPNFSIYSAASMDLARATDDLDKVQQAQKDEAHPSELADDTGDSEDDAVTNELAKESENSDVASPRSDDGKLLMELDDLPDKTVGGKTLLKEAGNADLIGDSSSDDSQDKVFTTEASCGKRSPSEDSQGKVLQSDESEDEVLPSTNFKEKVVLTDDSQDKSVLMDDSQEKVVRAENTQYRVMPSEDSQEGFVPSEDSQDKVVPSEDSQDKVVPSEDSQDKVAPSEDSQDKVVPNEDSQVNVALSEDSQDNVVQSDDSQNKAMPIDNSEDKVMWSEDSQDKVMQNDDSQVKEIVPVIDSQTKEVVPGEDSQDNGMSFEDSREKVVPVEDLHNIVMPTDDLQEKSMPTEGLEDKSMPTKDSREKILRCDDLQETALPSEVFQDVVEKSGKSQGNMQICEEESQDKVLSPEWAKDAGLDCVALGSRKYDPEEDTKDDLTDEENNSYSELLVRKVVDAQELESRSVCDEDGEVIISSAQILEGNDVPSPLGSVEEENFGEGDEMDKEMGNVEKEKCLDVCDDTFKDGGSPGSTCGDNLRRRDKDVDDDKRDDSAEKGLVNEVIVLGENENDSSVGGATRAVSTLTPENIPPPGLEGLETETISETEEAINFDDTISTEEVVYHEDGDLSSHKKRKKKKNRKTAEFFNERQASRKELAPIDYEEGEIVDDVQKKDKKSSEKKEKHDVHKVSSDDFDVAVSKLVLEEEKKKRKKKSAVDKRGASKERLILASSENKDKSKDKVTSKDDDENISWKKPSKSTKDRNYRDTKGKEQSPKGKDLSKKDIENKEKKRKKEKRKDMERYDVRKIVGDKKRKKRDEFGRDLPSRDRSYSRSHSRGRSYERLRNRSRSVSRGRGRSPIRTRTIWSMSRSRSRSRNRSRNRSGSRLRNKNKPRSRRSRSREKQRGRQSRDRSKSRGKHSRSKSRSRSINRLRPRSRSRTPARPREKKARSREQNVSARRQRTARDRRSWSHTWTPSWSRSRSHSYSSSYSSYSRSRTPSVRHVNRSYSRSFSRSWSRERHERIPIMNKRVDTITKSAKKLTVIVPNTKDDAERQRKKDKKRKEKKVKESVIEKRKKRKEKSPAPSKEVFTSGDNILVSVNFSKTNKTAGNKSLMASGVGVSVLPTATGKESAKRKHDGTFEGEIIKRKKDRLAKDKNAKGAILAGEKPMSEKKRKKLTKPSPRIAAIMNKKPVAIIDLDQSPFHEQTPSPTDLIVLSDSDEHLDKEQPAASPSPGEKDRAPTPPISGPQTPDSRSPMMNYLVTSTGPKTPPEPQIKFSVAPSKTQLRVLSNPLREEEMIDEEVVMDQHLDEDMDGVIHKGPNTPPEPRGPSTPRSPPISPDAYDPFDPTKSGTPSPVGMEISMDDEEPSPEGTLSEVPQQQQPSIVAVSSPPMLGDPEELPGKTTDVGPLLAASQDVEEEVILSPPAPPVVVPKSPPLLGEPIPATPVEPEPQPVQDEEPAVVVSEDSVSPQPQKLVVTPVKTQQQPQPQGQLFAAPKPGPQATSTPSVLPLPGFPSLTPSSIISLLTTPPVGRQPFSLLSQPARHNGEAKPEEEADPDMDSPYSPASSEGDDLFDPPPETSRPATRAASKSLSKLPLPVLPRKSQDRFDSLFGVSPLRAAKAASRSGRLAKSFPSKSTNKSKLKSSGKKEIAIKMDEDQLQILDELPSSAVEMQVKDKFLKKLNRQERVVEEVKLSLKPHYTKKHITKEEYKDILRRSVPKICHNKTGEINPVKIATLVEAYVKKYRYHKKKGGGGGGGVGSAAKTKLFHWLQSVTRL